MPAFDLLIPVISENIRFLFLSFIGQQVLIWEFDQIFDRRRSSLPLRIAAFLRTAFLGNWTYALDAYPSVFGGNNLTFLLLNLVSPLVIWWIVVWTYAGNDPLKVLLSVNVLEILMSAMTLLCLIPVNVLEGRDSLVFMYGRFHFLDLAFLVLLPLLAVMIQPLINIFHRRYEKWMPRPRFLFWGILAFYYAFSQAGALVDSLKSSNQFDRVMFPSYLGAALLIAVFLLLISRRRKNQLEQQKHFFETLLTEDVPDVNWCGNWQVNRVLSRVKEISSQYGISVDFNLLGFAVKHIDPEDVAFLLHTLFRQVLPAGAFRGNNPARAFHGNNLDGSDGSASLTLHCASARDLLVIQFRTVSAADRIQGKDIQHLITKYHGTLLVRNEEGISTVTIILVDV